MRMYVKLYTLILLSLIIVFGFGESKNVDIMSNLKSEDHIIEIDLNEVMESNIIKITYKEGLNDKGNINHYYIEVNKEEYINDNFGYVNIKNLIDESYISSNNAYLVIKKPNELYVYSPYRIIDTDNNIYYIQQTDTWINTVAKDSVIIFGDFKGSGMHLKLNK